MKHRPGPKAVERAVPKDDNAHAEDEDETHTDSTVQEHTTIKERRQCLLERSFPAKVKRA